MDRQRCLSELAESIAKRYRTHPVRVAIDGVDGVGKTTLADELVEPLRPTGRQVIRASIDGFHNRRALRYARGADSAEGYFLDSVDYAALTRELLQPPGPNGNLSYRRAIFDYRVGRQIDAAIELAAPTAVLLFDGVFLQCPELRSLWDLAVWVDTPFAVTVDRAVRRDAASDGEDEVLRALYERRYVPGQRLYLERCQPKQRATIVLNNAVVSDPDLEFRDA